MRKPGDNGSRCSLMQRIHSLEELIKKLCFQRCDGQEEMEAVSLDYKEEEEKGAPYCGSFQMPLHYPRYSKADYKDMAEWKLDNLLREYGLPIMGDVQQKRSYAIGAFLWPDQM